MALNFFETMSGELFDGDGAAHHVALDLKAESSRALGFVLDGRARLTGTIRALPWIDGGAVVGTLVARPAATITGGFMEYELTFTDAEDQPWRLRGRKDVTLLHNQLPSLTRLATELERDGAVVAAGTLQFFANDLPHFIRSFKGTAAFSSEVVTGTSAATLDRSQRATLMALAEVVIVPGGRVPAASAETVRRAEEYVTGLTPLVRAALAAALGALDAAARVRYRRRFSDLSAEQRRTLVEHALASRTSPLRAVVEGLVTPVKVGHFSRPDYLNAIGMSRNLVSDREPTPGWMANVATPDELPATVRVECDVVVVGTGAGGAAVAARLAEKGLAVVLVEEGAYAKRADFAGPVEDRLKKYWRDGGFNVALGNSAVAVPTGRLVGGTTAINSGTALRTPDAVLAEWRAAGFPSDFTPEAFGAYLDEVDAELQVAVPEDRYLGRVASVIAKGAAELGYEHGPLPRNAQGCDGQGVCVFGCPTDAKRSANITWIPRALKAGAQLFTGLRMTRVLMSGSAAVGVLAEGQDSHGAARRLEVQSRAVVLATGTLMTPNILRRNGIDLPWLGRNLSIHPAFGAYAMMPAADGKPWNAVPQSYHVTGLGDELVTYEGAVAPPSMASAALPFVGDELTRWMDSWDRVEQFGLMVRDTGVGSVHQGPGGRTLIRYDVTPRVLQAFTTGAAGLAELFLRGGADEVALPIRGSRPIRSVEEAQALGAARLKPRDFSALGFHPLGTARMGLDARTAVVDFHNRVFGTTRLYVADGSVVPTSLGVNPQMTIMAFALRTADAIAGDLGA
jgi:choline dehydrogenase-like flavoprotein